MITIDAKDRCCRTCIYWERPLGARALAHRVYACSAPPPDMRLPDSITKHYSFGEFARKYMERDEGRNCPAWSHCAPPAPTDSLNSTRQA